MTEDEKVRLVGIITRKRRAENGMEIHFLRVLDGDARPVSEEEREWLHFYKLYAGLFEGLRKNGSYFRTLADAEAKLEETRAILRDEYDRIGKVFEKNYDELHTYYVARNEGAAVDPDEPGAILDDIEFQVNGYGEDRAGLQRKIDLLSQVIRFMKA